MKRLYNLTLSERIQNSKAPLTNAELAMLHNSIDWDGVISPLCLDVNCGDRYPDFCLLHG